jgi:hypothetical protein
MDCDMLPVAEAPTRGGGIRSRQAGWPTKTSHKAEE